MMTGLEGGGSRRPIGDGIAGSSGGGGGVPGGSMYILNPN